MEAPLPATQSWSTIVKNEPLEKKLPAPAGDISRVVGSCKSSKGIAVAVVDANAIIQGGERLHSSADKFVSVSEVMSEIRDPVSRHRLALLPFTVDTVEPTPESLKKVIQFARSTGDLQTLSDVDLKLIALTYSLEAQIHGTEHLRNTPPPIRAVKVKRLPEKDMPGWGSNVPNLKEWEALENLVDDASNANSRILPLKEISSNIVAENTHVGSGVDSTENGVVGDGAEQEDMVSNSMKPKYTANKKEINIKGKTVAVGINASQGEDDDNSGDWLPVVSRSTHRRFLRRKERRDKRDALLTKDSEQEVEVNTESSTTEEKNCGEQLLPESSKETHVVNEAPVEKESQEDVVGEEHLSSILKEMRLEEDELRLAQEEEDRLTEGNAFDDLRTAGITFDNDACVPVRQNEVELVNGESEQLATASQASESVDTSCFDDNSSEQSWKLRSLSESTVACVTSDFAMQNVILQMGLRLLAPDGVQIRQLHRWILKCHACFAVTAEIGRIFCPDCGNGGTLRKVSVTVGENGTIQSTRRPRVTLRGTRYSLPLPKGGRDAITKNPVLREDQLPDRVLYPRKKKVNKQGVEIFTPDDIFSHHNDKKAPLRPPVGSAVSVFFQKRNPNDNHFSRSRVK